MRSENIITNGNGFVEMLFDSVILATALDKITRIKSVRYE